LSKGAKLNLRVGRPDEAGVSSSKVELIKERTAGWVKDGHQPCVFVLAARRGVIFLHEAYGVLGPEEDSPPVKLDTIFPLASLTKPFTAALAMTLVEEGVLGLNRPVADYIPEFKTEGAKNILIRHLLTHTSGMREEDTLELAQAEQPDLDEQALHRWLFENLDKWIDLIVRTTPHVPPDTVMIYADSNYELLAEVIKRVSKAELDMLAKARIFSPLGMKDSHYVLPDELNVRVVGRPEGAPIHFLEDTLRRSPSGNGGLYTTTMDAAKFCQMLLNNGVYGEEKILSSASVRAMTRNQIPGLGALLITEEFPNASWGLGWSVNAPYKGALYGEQLMSSSAFGHGGAGGVYLWIDPELDLFGIYFSVVFTDDQRWYKGFADLFVNMVMASVDEL
jgi:CubicO group peptidase (beta-lactamase class C family)